MANFKQVERMQESSRHGNLKVINDKEREIAEYFKRAEARVARWLLEKPTGHFSIKGFVNQGGLRGEAEINITEK